MKEETDPFQLLHDNIEQGQDQCMRGLSNEIKVLKSSNLHLLHELRGMVKLNSKTMVECKVMVEKAKEEGRQNQKRQDDVIKNLIRQVEEQKEQTQALKNSFSKLKNQANQGLNMNSELFKSYQQDIATLKKEIDHVTDTIQQHTMILKAHGREQENLSDKFKLLEREDQSPRRLVEQSLLQAPRTQHVPAQPPQMSFMWETKDGPDKMMVAGRTATKIGGNRVSKAFSKHPISSTSKIRFRFKYGGMEAINVGVLTEAYLKDNNVGSNHTVTYFTLPAVGSLFIGSTALIMNADKLFVRPGDSLLMEVFLGNLPPTIAFQIPSTRERLAYPLPACFASQNVYLQASMCTPNDSVDVEI